MTALVYAPEALDDLDRLTDFLLEQLPQAAQETTALILDALQMLTLHPQIGRPVELALRELVISRGKTGYVALYEFDAAHDLVVVFRIRHQREVGYPATPMG